MKFFRMAAAFIALATVAGSAVPQEAFDPSKAPAVVFIIRHAEKPFGDDKNPDLTPQGYQRAKALPSLFLPVKGSTALPRLPRPAALFASAPSKHSNRPIETITPLSQALGVRLNTAFDERETGPIAKEIMSGKYAGKVVLLCWHHGEIPHLAQAFGVTDAPKKWNDQVFDQIWMIEWVDGKPQFSTLSQKLLPGDAQ